jgi:hypothetical protein
MIEIKKDEENTHININHESKKELNNNNGVIKINNNVPNENKSMVVIDNYMENATIISENNNNSTNIITNNTPLPLSLLNKKNLTQRTKYNKNLQPDEILNKKRHFFVMTEGGVPIYSRYGDEVENCGILATFSAMMTKFTHFTSTSHTTEKLK